MIVYDAKQGKGVKLCNLRFGDLVMVRGSDGSSRGPLLLINPAWPQKLANAQLDPDALPMPLPNPNIPPPPAAPQPQNVAGLGSNGWGSHADALLVDPTNGTLYTAHPSTRAVVLKDAAIVRNYIEGN